VVAVVVSLIHTRRPPPLQNSRFWFDQANVTMNSDYLALLLPFKSHRSVLNVCPIFLCRHGISCDFLEMRAYFRQRRNAPVEGGRRKVDEKRCRKVKCSKRSKAK